MHNSQSFKAVAAVAALLLGLVTVTGAAPEQSEQQQSTTLIGMLAVDGAGGYILVEEQSGDSIALRGPSALADHLGATVEVSGRWVEDPNGSYFLVESVEAT